MYKTLLLLFLCIALTLAEPVPHSPSETAFLQQNTWVSAEYGQDIETQLLSQSVASLANCSVAGVIKNVAYILIDSADFANTTWKDVWGIVSDVSVCWGQERGLLGRIKCFLDVLPNLFDAFGDILQGVKVFIGNLHNILPVIKKEVDQCMDKRVQNHFE